MNAPQRRALAFTCEGEWMYGVLDAPAQPQRRGVLVVVGGPQYRAGSHRQFTLLARTLADSGVAAMRFDYRGMGDSEGALRSFESVDADLRAAIDTFFEQAPGLEEVVLWGLCDGASAALMYAASDRRVAGLVLLNPWVRTEGGAAKATLKHYYRDRLLGAGLWKKIASGRFDFAAAASSLRQVVKSASAAPAPQSLPERMAASLQGFGGKVLVILSGADLTAQEFGDLAGSSPVWRSLMAMPRISSKTLPRADHTCSRAEWQDQVAAWTSDWVASL
jgi:exosortase A-associated hydrolase 1